MSTTLLNWKKLPAGKEKYQAYLCSREWCEKREAVRKRCCGICERCFGAEMDHVHHLTYDHIYDEPLNELQAICKECHDYTHGKIDEDPISRGSPFLAGRPCRLVYLAGKMDSCWREEVISHEWRKAGLGSGDSDECHTPQGHRLQAIGPHYENLTGGHDIGDGDHCCGEYFDHHGEQILQTNRRLVFANRIGEIESAQLFFAWISCRTCYGTLAEIGFAAATKKARAHRNIVVAFSDNSLASDLWFAAEMADVAMYGWNSPGEAWKALWERLIGFTAPKTLIK